MKKLFVFAAAACFCFAANAQDFKFAHVNVTELIQLMPEMDAAREQIDAAGKEASDTYQAMVDEFQSKYSTYEQKQSTWTAAVKESKEKELGEINQRIQEFQQAIQQELQQQQNELMEPIQKKAMDTVNSIAKAKGCIYVFDVQSVLYVDPSKSIDITPDARKALNIPADRTLEALYKELQEKQQAQQAAAGAQQQ